MILRSTFAIVRRELAYGGALHAAAYFALCAFIGFWSARPGAPIPDSIAPLSVALALGVAFTRHARRANFLAYAGAPFYGRQLARALAIAPSLVMLAAPLGFFAGAVLRGAVQDGALLAVSMAATIVTTLVALAACFRSGRSWGLYLALAFGAGLAVILALVVAPSPAAASPFAFATAGVIGYGALVSLSETLARYDPL
jgi:hypothetical protein